MPSSFRTPAFLRARHSFHRLRSFHLSPLPPAANTAFVATQPSMVEDSSSENQNSRAVPSNLVIPLRGSTIITLAAIASIIFIFSISFAFLGADVEDPYFKTMLDDIATNSPGIILMGESVDVDVDEPSVTIRWSIMACGEEYVLPESTGVHGSRVCGLPSLPLHIFVDNNNDPAATYDPSTIPITTETGHRRNIQNLVQFDSDHVLDVHEARLYPFDTYFLTSTIRAADSLNNSIPIQKLATIDIMSSFDIGTIDMDSFSKTEGGIILPSRDIDIHIARPNSARLFALVLFAVSWILAHVTVGHVMMARRLAGMKPILKHLISSGAILIAIPQLRNSMPDAPGFDGVLIDTIGYFPQMIISSISATVLLLILAVREFDIIGLQGERRNTQQSHPHSPTSSSVTYPPPPIRTFNGNRNTFSSNSHYSSTSSRPPRSPTSNSSPEEIAEWERYRVKKHLTGDFVFPPVQLIPIATTTTTTASHRPQTSISQEPAKPSTVHRRVNTMTRIMEAGQVTQSRWSEEF